MSLFDPRLWLAFLAALCAAYGTGRFQQYRHDTNAHTAALLKQTEQARVTEHALQEKADGIRFQAEAQRRQLAVDLQRARDELRNRPERLPEAARASCAGATGRELSQRDAAAFIGLAARADELRTALGTCQAWAETVSGGQLH